MNLSLFIVVLGGRSLKSNIEIHDVRWVLGETIEDTFPELRKQWLGKKSGLHIDSYKCIKYIDGYQIVISKSNKDVEIKVVNNSSIISLSKFSLIVFSGIPELFK